MREIFKIQHNTPMVMAWDQGARVGMWWWEQVGIAKTIINIIG